MMMTAKKSILLILILGLFPFSALIVTAQESGGIGKANEMKDQFNQIMDTLDAENLDLLSDLNLAREIARFRPVNEKARSLVQRIAAPAAPAAPNSCPAAPAGLPDVIEPSGEEFCLFYDKNNTTLNQATRGADHTADYWEAYVDDMGFPAPEYSAVDVKFHVRLDDAGAGESVDLCNGTVDWGTTYMTVYDECDASPALQPQLYQLVFGHELYHQVQLSAGGDNNPATYNLDALWFHEGTARSMEDKVFENVDHWPNALAAPWSYSKEVNNYLSAPNNDITSDGMRYQSALWWTYYSEQCGATIHETRRGVDAFNELWDA